MSTNYNHHLSAMGNMQRHFNENTYLRFYAIFRKAEKLGGSNAVIAVLNASHNKRHGYNVKGLMLINKAYISWISDYRYTLMDVRAWTKRIISK